MLFPLSGLGLVSFNCILKFTSWKIFLILQSRPGLFKLPVALHFSLGTHNSINI